MPGKIHITPDGAQALRTELSTLWRVTRPEVTQAVKEAAALGDRSENADYIYGKKRLREIDKRIRYLQKRLDDLEVVDRIPTETDRVFFGAWVRLEDESGQESTLRIVGVDELDLVRARARRVPAGVVRRHRRQLHRARRHRGRARGAPHAGGDALQRLGRAPAGQGSRSGRGALRAREPFV